jgi:hypothetical protein
MFFELFPDNIARDLKTEREKKAITMIRICRHKISIQIVAHNIRSSPTSEANTKAAKQNVRKRNDTLTLVILLLLHWA